jgi:Uma2 family endonuclease
MAVTTLVPVEEYLRSVYHPDCDFVEGRLVERNLGEVDHSNAQSSCYYFLRSRFRQHWGGVEVRVQVKPDRFRVPDVSVVRGRKPESRIVVEPPALVVEVLSPDDRMSEMLERIDDYLEFGIPHVWVINPAAKRGFIYTSEGSHEAKDGVLRAGELEVPLAAIFED